MVPDSPPSRASVRRQIEEVLRTDADLDSFCLDYFPQVQRRFSEGMDRLKKLNLLLETEAPALISQRVQQWQSRGQARLQETAGESAAQSAASADRVQAAHDSPVLSRPPASVLWSTLTTTRGLVSSSLCVLCGGTLLLGVSAQPPWSLGALAMVALLLVANLGWIAHTLWQRFRIPSVSTTRFVGPLPMEEGDADRFFGREAKLQELQAKLAQRTVRHILVFGISGCGKTSLLRAGLIPRLRAENRYECVYLRFTDDPVGALQRALQAIGASDKPALGDPAPTLVAELQQARARSALPILLCIDQFEEFQINPIGGAGFRQVLDLIWAISGSQQQFDDVKLVLSLREDFLSLLTDFYQDRAFAQGEEKVRVEPFEEVVAKEVIERLLHSDAGGLIWDATLVRRVLDDLVYEKLNHGERRRYVLPTELQIVFQMVQSRRIYRDENYPGKKKLLLDYISEAIATVPGADPPLVKQLLLALIDAGGQTKAKPQTLTQLAHQVQAEAETVRRILLHLDLNRHVVRSLHPEKPARSSSRNESHTTSVEAGPLYELAHDYLAGVIRIVAGAEMSGAKRSQALIEMARLRAQDDPRYRLPILDCVQLWRYPAEESTPEDRALLRRSWLSFGLRYCMPLLCLLVLASFVRFGTHTIRLQYGRQGNEVVLIRGISALQPLLGARDVSASTGLDLDASEWHTEPSTKQLVDELTAGIWRPSALALLRPEWDPDRYLRQRVAQAIRPLAFPRGNGCMYTVRFNDDFAYLLLATSANVDQEIRDYIQTLQCGLDSYLRHCALAEDQSDDCTKQASVMATLSRLLAHAGAQGRQRAMRRYLSSLPSNATVPIATLKTLATIIRTVPTNHDGTPSPEDEALLRALHQAVIQKHIPINISESLDPQTDLRLVWDVAQWIDSLARIAKAFGSTYPQLIDNQPMVNAQRDVLLRALSVPMKPEIRRLIAATLRDLMKEDASLITRLAAQLDDPDVEVQTNAFSNLLDINPKLPALRQFFITVLEDTLTELKGYDRTSAAPSSVKSAHTLNLYAKVLTGLGRKDPSRVAALLQGPNGAFSRMERSHYEELIYLYKNFVYSSENSTNIDAPVRYVSRESDYYAYASLIGIWNYFSPPPNMPSIIDSLTEQQKTTKFIRRDLRIVPFLPKSPDSPQTRVFKIVKEDFSLSEKLVSMIMDADTNYDADCSWLAVALRYKLSNPDIERKRSARQDFCYQDLPEAIARYQILDNPTAADIDTLTAGVQKLRRWLAGPEGAKLHRYKSIVLHGYEFLKLLQQEDPRQKSMWVAHQRQELLDGLRRADAPLRHRLADVYLLQRL